MIDEKIEKLKREFLLKKQKLKREELSKFCRNVENYKGYHFITMISRSTVAIYALKGKHKIYISSSSEKATKIYKEKIEEKGN